MRSAPQLHDTRTGQVRPIEPREPNRIGIYVCGPTVYARIHVGNARPFVVFSLLKRFLAHEGYDVELVINITDVNDKIYSAARQARLDSGQLAREMADAYVADTDRLGLGRPDHEPRASQTIAEIITLIDRLVKRGYAYVVNGEVYFSVRSYPKYGELSHRDIEYMEQGEDVEGADLKRDPLDFSLWKARKPGEDLSWDSPWGRGRPGWHIECSAMAELLLGAGFEIHGGGSDLIFPHHENEAAQTYAAHGVPLASMWVHNGLVRINRDKMAKSVGNVFLLRDALDDYGRDALIMYFCAGHYRQPTEFDEGRLEQAALSVGRVREAVRRLAGGPSPTWSRPLQERFFSALSDDFNTPRALAALFDWVREANRAPPGSGSDDLRDMLDVLGLANLVDLELPEAPPELVRLLELRERARAARDYAKADRLREELRARGWQVLDGPDGAELRSTARLPGRLPTSTRSERPEDSP